MKRRGEVAIQSQNKLPSALGPAPKKEKLCAWIQIIHILFDQYLLHPTSPFPFCCHISILWFSRRKKKTSSFKWTRKTVESASLPLYILVNNWIDPNLTGWPFASPTQNGPLVYRDLPVGQPTSNNRKRNYWRMFNNSCAGGPSRPFEMNITVGKDQILVAAAPLFH